MAKGQDAKKSVKKQGKSLKEKRNAKRDKRTSSGQVSEMERTNS